MVTTNRFFSWWYLAGLTTLIVLSGCGKREKLIEEMNFKELAAKSEDAIDRNKEESAIPYLERIVLHHSDDQHAAEYKLKLADLYLKSGRHEAAYVVYENFANLYPAHPKVEYAHYKQILAKFYQTLKLHEACDATLAEQAVDLCKGYLKNDKFVAHRQDVSDIVTTCQNRLLDKEVYIFSGYLRRGKFNSAKTRLAHLKEKYGKDNKELEPRLLFLECKLAHKQNDKQQEEKLFNDLLEQYPESQFTHMAQGFMQKPQRPTEFIA